MRQLILHNATSKGGVAVLAARQVFAGLPVPAFALKTTAAAASNAATKTPIKHVNVIIGENRTFDHIFATYIPVQGETVDNLFSKAIIRANGSPGPNYFLALQYSAVDNHHEGYQVSPMGKSLYSKLPPPLAGGPSPCPFLPESLFVPEG